MKGIILAGGSATRLHPVTKVISKHLLPIYDKPMIYYPLSVLLLGKIRDILLISTERDIERFKELLKDGSDWGINIDYAIQNEPRGIADALLVAEDFIKDDYFTLVLGDNVFFGHGLTDLIKESINTVYHKNSAVIWAYTVKEPEYYGVVEIGLDGNPISIQEKPRYPKSNWAIVGIYFYPPDAIKKAKTLSLSPRGELEITDLNKLYIEENRLRVKMMGRGYAWLDTGTAENLLIASQFVETIEKRTGLKIACLEEIAYRNGFINKERLLQIAQSMKNSAYGKYILKLTREL